MNALLEDRETLGKLRARAQAYADYFKLPFRNRIWKGQTGDFLGAGVGSSLDFQDHRAYLPGDDPRHINWQAYARTGNYSMKLYREEVRPLVDVVCDVSDSMFFMDDKAMLSVQLFFFCAEAALRTGASLRAFLVKGEKAVPLSEESLHGNAWPDEIARLSPASPSAAPELGHVPLRAHSMRIFISDLLFPSGPQHTLSTMAAHNGRGIVFAPYNQSEADPGWSGNYEFIEAERKSRHQHRVEPALLRRYLQAYGRHFDVWKSFARKYGVILARTPAGVDFAKALEEEAMHQGALETWM